MVLVSPPKYAFVASDLASRIRSGSYPVGSYLPSENELQEQYHVSRTTVRQALAKLREAGMVVPVHGKGTKVLGALTRPLGQNLSFTDALQGQGVEPGTIVLDVRRMPANAEAAERLSLPVGTDLLLIDRLRTVNGEVLSHAKAFVRTVGTVEPRELERGISLYQYLKARLGLEICYVDDEISAEPASAAIAQELHIRRGEPVFVMRRIGYTSDNVAVEYSHSTIRADRMRYRSTSRFGTLAAATMSPVQPDQNNQESNGTVLGWNHR